MTPLILAVDTTGEYGSLALARGGEILEEVSLRAPEGYAQVLFGAISGLLERHGTGVAQIDCFAAASGPGTFTGVRVGLACVKGLAEAAGKLAVGVSNLEAVASFGSGPRRGAVLDARRGDVYAAVYDAAGRAVSAEVVTRLPAWLASLGDPVELVVQDGELAPDAAMVAPRELAAAIARIAFARWQRGEAGGPESLDANYVRRSDAELLLKQS